MIKNNKLSLALTSAVTLMPIVVGLILWDKLPDTMVIHWNIAGNADGFTSKTFAVFGMPILLLILHWVCIIFSTIDKRNENQNPKMQKIVLWICPILSWVTSGMMCYAPMDTESDVFNAITVVFLFLGLMFCVIGNYLPKCKQNATMGIRLKWTLENEENWNKTHRLGGIVWFICGLIMLIAAFLPIKASISVMVSVLAVAVIVPLVYSYLIHRKMLKSGEYNPINTDPWGPNSKNAKIISTVLLVLVLGFTLFITGTGEIEITCSDTAVEINADYWNDISFEYKDIDSVTIRDDVDIGMKTNGFDSPKLMLGIFMNDEFGKYTRYTYRKNKLCIVIEDEGNTLVFGGKNDEATLEIYNEIISNL